MGHDRIIAAQYTSCCHCAKNHYYTYRQQTHSRRMWGKPEAKVTVCGGKSMCVVAEHLRLCWRIVCFACGRNGYIMSKRKKQTKKKSYVTVRFIASVANRVPLARRGAIFFLFHIDLKAMLHVTGRRVHLTSELLTRPSWKEQSLAFCVHMWRYLHQWHGKEPFTQERQLR